MTDIILHVAIIWIIAVVTPGPNIFITAHRTMKQSYRAGQLVALGISIGTVTWAIFSFLGLSFVFQTAPWIYAVIKSAGGTYLIYLGVKLIITSKEPEKNKFSDNTYKPQHNIRMGFLTNISNPKSGAFMASVYAITLPENVTFFTGFSCILTIFLISLCYYSSMAFFFSMNPFCKLYAQQRNIIEKISGTLFLGFGIKLIFDE